ncbi:MAG: cysteine desulfurase [Nanoarchaeota archaeon]|nr:cysteine desulfurase [Nanoarchaeota archaeon]
MSQRLTYMDNGATAKVSKEILEAMQPYYRELYGNASSTHKLGRDAKQALEDSRKVIADSIKASPREIVFTSGGTESNNFAIKSIAFTNRAKGNHIITTKVEHKCVLRSCKWLESQGFKVTYLDVDSKGFISPEVLEAAITKDTILVSILHGNNEVGTINDLEALGKITKKHNVYFHTDACQSYTKTDINVKKQNVDLITLNSHKIHGPKGVGALYIRTGVKIEPWQHGGDHEFGMRAGTENIHGVVGFAKAVQIASNKQHILTMTLLRDKLINRILKTIPDTKLNGPTGNKRLCNNINFSFKAVEGEAIGGYLDQKGICSSTGSACSEATLEPSYVLTALGLSNEEANGSLRLTLSRFTTEEEVNHVLTELPKIITKLRRMSPLTRVVDYVLTKSN